MKLLSPVALLLLGACARNGDNAAGLEGAPESGPALPDSIVQRECLEPPDANGGCVLRDQGLTLPEPVRPNDN